MPIALAALTWWLTTVLALYRTGLPEESYGRTFAYASAIALLGLGALLWSASQPTAFGAYVAFLAALALWSWHEISYFLGYVSGPRPASCPPNLTGWQRFVHGVRASLWHELAIIGTAVCITLLTWGQPNQVGLAVFVVLWLMRWSTKLNIFLGVRNVHIEFLPPRMKYLATYMSQRHTNPLFPLSLVGGTLLTLYYSVQGLAPGASEFAMSGSLLLATLTALAVLEHLFLMLDLKDDRLWQLARVSQDRP